MLTSVLCLFAAAIPQQPVAGGTDAVPPVARLMPRNVLAAVIVDRPGSRTTDLSQTGLAQLLKGNGNPITGMLPAVLQQVQAAGLDAKMQRALLAASIGVGWTGMTRDGRPGFVIAIDFLKDEKAAEQTLALLKQKLTGQTETVDGIEVHATGQGPLPASYVIRTGNAVVLTTDREALVTAARPGPRNPTLAALPAFADEFQDSADGAPLATLFVRASAGADALARAMPDFAEQIGKVGKALQIDRMQHVVAAVRLHRGSFVERVRVTWPAPQRGLLGALIGTPGGITRVTARLVPPEAQVVAMGMLDWHTLLEEVLGTAGAVDPAARTTIEGALDAFAMQNGIDVRTEVFAQLTGQSGAAWWSEGEGQRFVLWQQLKDPKQLAGNWRKLAAATGLPVEDFDCNGSPSLRAQQPLGPDLQPSATIFDGHLLIASSPKVLSGAIANAKKPQTDAKLVAFIEGLPAQTTWAVWTRVAGHAAPGAETMTVAAGQQSLCLIDERGVTLETRSGLGTFGAIVTAMALPALVTGETVPGQRPVTRPETRKATPAPTQPADPLELQTLATAEKAGRNLDVAKVKALLASTDGRVAARAAWLLGRSKAADAVPELCNAVQTHQDGDVRTQAMAALERLADPRSLQTAMLALGDDTRTVRALAASTIGRLRNPAATASLLAMLGDRGKEQTDDKPSDVMAALLALNDLNSPASLLQAASAIGESTKDVSEALTFLFQNHSTTLPPKEEATLLLAVLDHADAMLRRYAIQRLGELRDPTTAKALEGRLAVENQELQHLVQVSLTAVRGEVDGEASADPIERVKTHVGALAERVTSRWDAMDTMQRGMLLALVVLVAATLVAMLLVMARIRRNRRANASAMLIAPSADYLGDELADSEAPGEQYDQEEAQPARTPFGRGRRI